jgi:hypothetical protein
MKLFRESTPKKGSEILEAERGTSEDLTALAQIGETTLKSVGFLLRNTEPNHG